MMVLYHPFYHSYFMSWEWQRWEWYIIVNKKGCLVNKKEQKKVLTTQMTVLYTSSFESICCDTGMENVVMLNMCGGDKEFVVVVENVCWHIDVRVVVEVVCDSCHHSCNGKWTNK